MGYSQILKATSFWIILFLILGVLQWAIDFGVRHSNYSDYEKVNIIAGEKIDPTLAVFGSSVGQVGVNTALLSEKINISSYNFSIDGTRFMQYKGLIEELNNYSKECKVVVFAEAFFSLAPFQELTEINRYIAHLDKENIYKALHAVQPELVWKLKHVPFYKFVVMDHEYLKASMIGFKGYFFHQNNDPQQMMGYTPKKTKWQRGLDSLNAHSQPTNIEIDSVALFKYRIVLEELVKTGRKVLIVLPPIHVDGLRLLNNMDCLRECFNSLQKPGVVFKDYSLCELSYDKSNFYNNSHLNAAGADNFTALLAKDISDLLVDNDLTGKAKINSNK
jgi:hypothetical protein